MDIATATAYNSTGASAGASRAALSAQTQKDTPAQFQSALQADLSRPRRDAEEARRGQATRVQEEVHNSRPTESISLEARVRFEYEQQQRVMKVQDSKGVLIYQVPPKGALHLVLQDERQAAQLEETA